MAIDRNERFRRSFRGYCFFHGLKTDEEDLVVETIRRNETLTEYRFTVVFKAKSLGKRSLNSEIRYHHEIAQGSWDYPVEDPEDDDSKLPTHIFEEILGIVKAFEDTIIIPYL